MPIAEAVADLSREGAVPFPVYYPAALQAAAVDIQEAVPPAPHRAATAVEAEEAQPTLASIFDISEFY